MSEQPDLKSLQSWMSITIRHKKDAQTAVRSKAARSLAPLGSVTRGEIILPNDRMTPTARLQVYNGGYFTRLKEVLEIDYKVLLRAMGDHAFFHLALDYVDRHPSRHPNLNLFGKQLPDFIATRRGLANRAFLRDLACLECTMVDAFSAPEFTPLDPSSLAHLTQEQWNDAVLQVNPSVRLLRSSYPVNTYLQAILDDGEPEFPGRETKHLVVYRKDDRVWRLNLPGPMYRILQALMDGEPFGQALARGGKHSLDISKWFQEWSADGLFSGIDANRSPGPSAVRAAQR
jgi:hypothetical protein